RLARVRARGAPARAGARVRRQDADRQDHGDAARRGFAGELAARPLAGGHCRPRRRRSQAAAAFARDAQGRQVVNLAWIEPLKNRWQALGAHERRPLTVLAVFLVPVLVSLLVWSPVESGLAKSTARLSTVQGQLAQVREQAALVTALRAA